MAFVTENLSQVIRQVGEPIARALGIEILDIQCTGKPTSPLVRLTLDKDGGIGIEDCEQFHQSLPPDMGGDSTFRSDLSI